MTPLQEVPFQRKDCFHAQTLLLQCRAVHPQTPRENHLTQVAKGRTEAIVSSHHPLQPVTITHITAHRLILSGMLATCLKSSNFCSNFQQKSTLHSIDDFPPNFCASPVIFCSKIAIPLQATFCKLELYIPLKVEVNNPI